MVRLTIALALAATFAVFTALLRDLSGNVDSLRDRLAASDDARRDVVRLFDQNRRDVDARLARDVEGMHRDILGPSLQVTAQGGVGGGTILSSSEGRTWAVTAWHVVQKAVREDGRDPVEVKIYDAGGAPAESVQADLVVWDEAKDLALLRLRDGKTARPARLASRRTLRSIQVFTPLYTVGCPLGHDPLPTRGEVATLSKDVAGERFWMMNAPTIYGNSGGGVFHGETRELIGVSVMICTYDGAVSTPVPHLGILAPLATVYDWLDSLGYAHAYDPSASVEACEADRNGIPSRNADPVGRGAESATAPRLPPLSPEPDPEVVAFHPPAATIHPMRLRVERERELYRGRVVRLVERDFVLPNGRKTTFGIVEHPGAVAIVPVFENGDVLLLKQFRPTIDRELYEIPAGTLEPGESPLATAKREIVEETGHKARTWTKISEFYSAPGFCTELLHVFEASGLSPAEAEKDADEILRPVRMSLKEALALIDRRKIRDAKSIAGLLVHEQRRKKQKSR